MNKINPRCPQCHLINIIFNDDNLPMKCQFCGAALEGYLGNEKRRKIK